VSFSLWTRVTVVPGTAVDLDLVVHKASDNDAVLERFHVVRYLYRQLDYLLKSEGPVDLARGTTLTAGIYVADIEVHPSWKTLMWRGEIGYATFILKIPKGCPAGVKIGRASIMVNGLEVADIRFSIEVSSTPAVAKDSHIEANTRIHRSAFASYASQDRDAVLARIQGMQKVMPSLEVFLDAMSLRSGENWGRRLFEEIPKADIFYLFWCRHARESRWVRREWRCAFKAKGIDFIDPIPLESPKNAPPPEELKGKHFNDPILAFMTPGIHP
jgi:hypothetical protein